ncbi:hypothetical protein [Sphingosinicella soli]|uniref:Uncharacterized protein n=1 Tax=Sphingosinicella soli TaxID=333708 RepID=A0A7W7F6L3_9SPHN|nr:hypothetical protein [Sphingosinicella soli]MBB4631864.1 hypothetical protein [Sphingosinicella soli]
MERARVIEIIAAYGGYPAAWPPEERAAAERLVLSDAPLAAAMNEARGVDRLLRDWACELVPATDAEADAAADRALAEAYLSGAPRRMWMRAAFGGAIAASLAIGAVLLSRPDAVPGPAAPDAPPPVQVALGDPLGEDAQAAHDMLVWGNVFTPTPEEEMVL